MKNKLATSTCFYERSSVENWRKALDAGITDAELSVGVRPADVGIVLAECEAKYSDMTAAGITVSSFHIPFTTGKHPIGKGWDITHLDPGERDSAIFRIKRLLEWVGGKGIGIAVLHANGEPVDDPSEREARMAISCRAIKELSDFARKKDVRIAIESMTPEYLGGTCDELMRLTGDGTLAGICFDVNHLLIESPREFIEKIGKHIITTHLSDNNGVEEQHWLIGDGCIDWAELIGLLAACGYGGRYLFEIHQPEPVGGVEFPISELVRRFYAHTGQTDKR